MHYRPLDTVKKCMPIINTCIMQKKYLFRMDFESSSKVKNRKNSCKLKKRMDYYGTRCVICISY